MDLREVLCYELGPIHWAIEGVDDILVKTARSSLLEVLEKDLPAAENILHDTPWVTKGMAVSQSFTSVPDTFANLTAAIFKVVTAPF